MSTETPIWYPTMNDEERLELLANYKPEEHLTSWDKGGEALIYYPSAWRLYELRLRFPNVMIDTDIYHFNEASGFIILVSCLYMGESYEKSKLRAKAFKQGQAGKLDSLQTMCEARAARNFGISPTLALDVDDTDIARIAIKSEAEHQAKRNAAAGKRNQGNQNQQEAETLKQRIASMKKIADALKVEMPSEESITIANAEKFIKANRAAYQQVRQPAPTTHAQETTEPQALAQAEPQSAPPTALETKKAIAIKWAERLQLSKPPAEAMDEAALDDKIIQYKQEYQQRQQSAKQEAAARAELAAQAGSTQK